MSALSRRQVAWRAAQDIPEGWTVNLGIGIPTLVPNFLPPDREVIFHSENGVLGVGPAPAKGAEDPDLINATKEFITLVPGGSFFAHSDAFVMIRGGHLDLALLGAFQVAANGDLANWSTDDDSQPPGVGGAMDLAAGARHIRVLMTHTGPGGVAKLVQRCTLPLTTTARVERIYTDLGVLEPAGEAFRVLELAPGIELAALAKLTGAPLTGEPVAMAVPAL